MDLILKNAGQEPLLLAQFYLKEFSEEETAPIRIQLDEPHYRDAIYASMPCETIRGRVLFSDGFPAAEVSFNGEIRLVTPDVPEFDFPAANLADGEYELTATVQGAGATPVVSRKVIHKYPHCNGEITIGKDKHFFCDGTRFFPFFLGYAYEDPEKPVMSYLAATRGMNGRNASGHASAERTIQELDRAHSLGLKVMLGIGSDLFETQDDEEAFHREMAALLVPEVISHPALFGYNFCDEPWAREVPAYKFPAAERIFRELDPYHPLFM